MNLPATTRLTAAAADRAESLGSHGRPAEHHFL
jgi:hypothetical protein